MCEWLKNIQSCVEFLHEFWQSPFILSLPNHVLWTQFSKLYFVLKKQYSLHCLAVLEASVSFPLIEEAYANVVNLQVYFPQFS